MNLLINNQTVPTLSVKVVEDIRKYYSTIEVVAPLYLPSLVFTLQDPKFTDQYHIVRSIYENGSYHYTAVSSKVYDLINTTFEPYSGVTTIKKLLSRVGLPYSFSQDSSPVYYRIPSCKLLTLFSFLSLQTSFPNGGAPRFYLDDSGHVNCFDLKNIFTYSKSIDLAANVSSDHYSLEECTMIQPGSYELVSYSANGTTTKNLTFLKDFGKGMSTVNDTTGYETDLRIRNLRNSFLSKYYTSRTLLVDVAPSLQPMGGVVSINGTGRFIVTGRISDIQDNTPPQVTLILSSPYENS